MDDDISKPVSPEELRAALTRVGASKSPSAEGPQPAPVFDRSAAMDLVGDDADLLRAIVEMFLQHAPERLAKIGAAVGSADASELERTAHALKGSAATLGLERVRALSLVLEDLGASGSVTGAEAHLERLEGAVEEGLEALREELGKLA